uniref:Guided entry of tail-anchored proteins factor 1 n=1 Tax=Cacopsylla melanoneura TaxID=428564 RepID=A0A8D9BFN0_9HEMI
MISLLVLGILINILRLFIPQIGNWIVKTFLQGNTHMQTTKENIKASRKVLATISIVDEFAKHARLTRKITALQNQLDEATRENAAKCIKIKFTITVAFYSILFQVLSFLFICFQMLLCAVIFFKSSEPVVQIPRQWMFPLSYFGSGDYWSIGFTSWLAMSYMCIKHINSAFTNTT